MGWNQEPTDVKTHPFEIDPLDVSDREGGEGQEYGCKPTCRLISTNEGPIP